MASPTVTPGPGWSPWPTDPSVTSAYSAGAMNMPSACLTSRSRRKRSTSRGLYWPAPNWTTTTATDTTRPVNAIMPPATAFRISRALSAVRSSASGSDVLPSSSSGTILPSARAATT